jgi:hypothetical protein
MIPEKYHPKSLRQMAWAVKEPDDIILVSDFTGGLPSYFCP